MRGIQEAESEYRMRAEVAEEKARVLPRNKKALKNWFEKHQNAALAEFEERVARLGDAETEGSNSNRKRNAGEVAEETPAGKSARLD